MWLKWLPWRFIVRRAAVRRGFIDPIAMLARFQNFSQPSDVLVPTELLRSGLILHARGLMNSQAIQHNLDWVWPYWVERQFDPNDPAFIPRAFSIAHINLTYRNWTAVGIPDCMEYPLVDPRGLITPLFDGWSLDAWILTEDRRGLIPSRLPQASQTIVTDDNLKVITQTQNDSLSLNVEAEVVGNKNIPRCQMKVTGLSNGNSWLVISLRPYNPEGVSFIHDIELLDKRQGWLVNKKHTVYFDNPADQYEFSYYRHGDVYSRLPSREDKNSVYCKVGMATAAALFKLNASAPRTVTAQIPLLQEPKEQSFVFTKERNREAWQSSLSGHCQLRIPDQHFQFLYDTALRTLILHSPKEVYPGPYTYKHFWFRDAAFILQAMLCVGFTKRVERVIDLFPRRQQPAGYFLSQEGEWDSNGEALWIIQRFCQMTARAPKPEWLRAVDKGALWISRKRMPIHPASAHAGLLPPGFSAEHFGPNDYYYWDNFWGIAGLKAAANLEKLYGNKNRAEHFNNEARGYLKCVNHSLSQAQERLGAPAMPAAPYRRMDSGAIGSLAAGYPLEIFSARDERLMATADYLFANCSFGTAFFHDMAHSGINPYLTLHMAQVFLRAGDKRYFDLMTAVAELASPTGQWPEAIHPRTKGGCMGDGQHVWAAAEWILMIRNCFVREEGERLILGSGIPMAWLDTKTEMSFGPAQTFFGSIDIKIKQQDENVVIEWTGKWFDQEPEIEARIPGFQPVKVHRGHGRVTLKREKN